MERMETAALHYTLTHALADYTDEPWLAADAALAALGLDDFEAAVERASQALRDHYDANPYPSPYDRLGRLLGREDALIALEAALTATGESE